MKKYFLQIRSKLRQITRKYIYKNFYTATPATVKGLKHAFKILKVNGDYYEFGLYKGFTFYKAHIYAGKQRKIMNFFGFDSFEGLPKIYQKGIDGGNIFFDGQYACSLSQVELNLKSKNVMDGNTYLIKGFFSETLNNYEINKKFPFRKASIVLIDCDLYESTKDVLHFIKNKLQVGTIILFDDWNCFDANPNKGERKAFHDFLQENNTIKVENINNFGWHGTTFLITKI